MTYHLIPGDFLIDFRFCKKTHIFFSLLFLGCLVCSSSCVSAAGGKDHSAPPYTWLTDSKKFTLLPPADIETPLDSHQLISASYDGRDYQIIAWVRADKTGLDMTLVNELGANMGELSYRDGAVSFSSSVFPASLRPEYIVADFQFCFYNDQKLRRTLEENGFSLEKTETGRRVLKGDTVIIEIEKSQNIVKFINYLRGYAYTVEGNFE